MSSQRPILLEMTHAEETAACVSVAEHLGRRLAHLIFMRIIYENAPADDMHQLVTAAIDDVRRSILAGGARREDVEAIIPRIELALVRTGKDLATTLWFAEGAA